MKDVVERFERARIAYMLTGSKPSQDLLSRLSGLATLWRAGGLDAPAFAALYFFYFQIATHGQGFAARKRKGDARPDAQKCLAKLEAADRQTLPALLLDYLARYQFHGVIANVPATLTHWLRGAWPLALQETIPSPRDILHAQARGGRPVTVISAYPRLLKPVLDKQNAFAFFLHDVAHAYKFFHSPALYAGQRAFFAALERATESGTFAPYLDDPGFVEKFHYLMSDMNTHPQHSRQYLRAILIEFHLQREGKPLTAPLQQLGQRAIHGVMRMIEDAPSAACG